MKEYVFKASGDLAMRPEAVGLTWPRAPREWECRDGIAVVSISGPLDHKGGWWFDTYEAILERFEGALCDDDVSGVILLIDSPGGVVSGLHETVRRMRALREDHGKPVIAVADDEAYSAAYALATAADEIYLPKAGGVGSVGVLATLCDRTEMTKDLGLRIEVVRSGQRKAEGHPDLPLTDATIGRVQRRVDDLAKQFFSLVSEVRPTSKKELDALQGACVYGPAAVTAGLADGVASFEEAFEALRQDLFDNDGDDSIAFLPTGRKAEEKAPMAFAILEKRVSDALAALGAAKTAAERKSAAASYAKAVSALTEAKVKKSYKKKTVTTEEEEETDDGDESAEDEDDEGRAGEPDDDDDEEDDEDEEKKTKKSKKAAASAGGASLASFVQSLTGVSDEGSARQVLASMHEAAQQAQVNADKIAALEKAAVDAKKDRLIAEGMAAGQIKPAQLDWARTQSVASLRAYLKATPAMFAPRQKTVNGSDEGQDTAQAGADGLTATERKICEVSGVDPKKYAEARAAGVSIPKVN